jgi:regulator of sigma E protease
LSFFSASTLSAFPQFALVLGIMVIVHELGHFIAAKLCGVRVEAFAIGFGKRLFGFVHNGTDYCVNLVPLGGYVKMTNEMPDGITQKGPAPVPTTDPGDFQNHPRWQRTLIAVAGPVANFILAFILLTALFMHHHEISEFLAQPATVDYVTPNSQVAKTGIQPGDRIVKFDNLDNPTWGDLEQQAHFTLNHETPFAYVHDGKRIDTRIFVENKGRNDEDFSWAKLGAIPVMQPTPVEVAQVTSADSPAALAGLKPHDLVVAIDNLHPHSLETLLAFLQDQGGKPAVLTIQRPGAPALLTLPITPVQMDTAEGKGWRIGFQRVLPPVKIEQLSFAEAVDASWSANLKSSTLIFEVLHRLFTRQVSIKAMSSPIGMGVMVHQAFESKNWKADVIETMAMISLNLGIFNLLPIPILDGGMILFLAIESLMRRDLNQAVKERVYQVAFVCLVLFAAVVIFNDLTKLIPTHLKT